MPKVVDREFGKAYNTRASTLTSPSSCCLLWREVPVPDVPNPAAAAAKANDSVTIFSNGVGHLRTHATVPKGKDTEFNLPFKQASMEDVLASFTTFGKVIYTRPASFTQPTKKSAVRLGDSTFESLAAFRGTKVKAQYGTASVEGTLFNTDSVDEATANGNTVPKRSITILTANGLETIPWAEVKKFEFTEPEIKTEIEKALAASRQALKPDAVFLNVGLKSKDEADQTAMFQWVEQLSPWSLSYRLNRAANGSYKLDAFGVIHNTTDSDWKDTIFTLVTGKPLTFISDLDKQRTVQRTTVNIQDTVARGGFIAEDGILLESQGFENQLESTGGGMSRGAVRTASRAMPSLAAMPQADMGGAEAFGASNFMGSQIAGQKAAPMTTVTAEEVGDFCIYTQDAPLTIPANTTASLPLFSKDLGEASQVLIYDARKNATRPFRAIKFKNEMEQTLGMGVCVVFEKNLFQGKCVMNASKPGEQRMLYYAEETGVAVKALQTRLRDHRDRLLIAKGVATARTWQSMTTTYTLRNVKNEEFTVLVEYQKNLDSSSECKAEIGGEAAKPSEELQNGLRYTVKLPAKGTVTVVVTEKFLHSQAIEMVSNTDWFIENYLNSAATIRDDKKVKAVLTAKKKVDEKQAEINASQTKVNKANQESGKLTQILQIGANAGNLKEYQDDLKAVMKTLKTEGEKQEKAQGELAEAKTKFYEEIAKLQGDWAYTPTDEAEEVKAVG